MTVIKETKKMRKNLLTWLVILLFGVVASLTGCERKESSKSDKPSASAEKKEEQKDPGVVTLSPEKQKVSGIEVEKVVSESLSLPISATAVIELNADKLSKVSSRVTGKIARVTVSQGDRVKAGQALAYLDTVELDQTCSEYLKAKSRRELALSNLKREETLFEKKVSPEKDVLRARQELSEVEADLLLAKEKFRVLGIDVSQMDLQKNGGGVNHPLLPISSLIDGVVLEKSVIQGEVVSPEKALFTVSDLSTLWLIIDIYEQDLGRVKTGMQVKLSISAFTGKEFKGKISYMGDVIDEKTRTVKARVTIDNRDGFLKPGMFATVSIDSVKDSRAVKAITVPEEAVFLDGSERYVFIREGDGRFVVRRVSVGPSSGVKTEIKDGLKVGDEVVTKGVFTLKSELKKETLEAE